jgi:hypothetical protein
MCLLRLLRLLRFLRLLCLCMGLMGLGLHGTASSTMQPRRIGVKQSHATSLRSGQAYDRYDAALGVQAISSL